VMIAESLAQIRGGRTAAVVRAIHCPTNDRTLAANPAIQHGCDLLVLRRARTYNPDGIAAGPLALHLDTHFTTNAGGL
jgi:hypothetical protein